MLSKLNILFELPYHGCIGIVVADDTYQVSWVLTCIVIGFILVVSIVGLFFLFNYVGVECQFCSNMHTTPFEELPVGIREDILRYFEDREKRVPDVSGIFVCLECKTVFDDFSGRKYKREADTGSEGCTTFCKVCERVVSHCSLRNDNIICLYCGTHYRWEVHQESGFRFLSAPAGTPILAKCSDIYWAAGRLSGTASSSNSRFRRL